MISHVMSEEIWDIIKQFVQVSLNIIKRMIGNSTRRIAKAPKVVESISRGKKRMRAPPQILAQARIRNVLIYV